jgi:hypothetical protein
MQLESTVPRQVSIGFPRRRNLIGSVTRWTHAFGMATIDYQLMSATGHASAPAF